MIILMILKIMLNGVWLFWYYADYVVIVEHGRTMEN